MSSALNDLEVRLTEMKLTGQKREDRIFVGNLAPQMTEDEIRALFNSTVYKISEVRIITGNDRGFPNPTRTPRRYAFVTFERKEDVAAALKELQGQHPTVHGRKLVIAEAYKMANNRQQANAFPFLAGGINPYAQYRWAQAAAMQRTMPGFPFPYPMAITDMALGYPIMSTVSSNPAYTSPTLPSSVPTTPTSHVHPHQVPSSRLSAFGDGYLASAGILPNSSNIFDFSSVSHLNTQSGTQGMKYSDATATRVPASLNNYGSFLHSNHHSHAGGECSGCIQHNQQVQEDAMRYQSQSAHAPAFWKQTHGSIS